MKPPLPKDMIFDDFSDVVRSADDVRNIAVSSGEEPKKAPRPKKNRPKPDDKQTTLWQ